MENFVILQYNVYKFSLIRKEVIMDWLLENLEWIVGSIVALLGVVFGTSFIIKKNIQKSGKNSTNIQIGEINYDKRK